MGHVCSQLGYHNSFLDTEMLAKGMLYVKANVCLIPLYMFICRSPDKSSGVLRRKSPSPDPFNQLLAQYLQIKDHSKGTCSSYSNSHTA